MSRCDRRKRPVGARKDVPVVVLGLPDKADRLLAGGCPPAEVLEAVDVACRRYAETIVDQSRRRVADAWRRAWIKGKRRTPSPPWEPDPGDTVDPPLAHLSFTLAAPPPSRPRDAYRDAIAHACRTTAGSGLRRPLDGPVRAAVLFVDSEGVTAKTPDLTRAVINALTGLTWKNDAQVVELRAVKRTATAEDPPRVEVLIDQLRGEPAPPCIL